MIILIDNYDSFTYNLLHYLYDIGQTVEVLRNDAATAQEVMARNSDAIVLSPGPSTPDRAGICLELIGLAAQTHTPLLGVCLGHQAIGQYFGGKVVRAPVPIHGKTSPMHHQSQGIFTDLPIPFMATRYHSLIVEHDTLPACLQVTAWTEDTDAEANLIMGLQHDTLPIHGVQFHPESIASEHGHQILRNFITRCL